MAYFVLFGNLSSENAKERAAAELTTALATATTSRDVVDAVAHRVLLLMFLNTGGTDGALDLLSFEEHGP